MKERLIMGLASSFRRGKSLQVLSGVWQRPALWLFILLLALYLLTTGADFYTSDGVAMYRTTEAIVLRRTLAVEKDSGLPQLVPGWDGRWYSMYDLGQPLAAIPFYLVGWILSRLLPHGDQMALTVLTVSSMPQVATALAGVALYRLACMLYRSRRAAVAVALLWGTGTLAWPYSKVYFAEALLTLCLVLAACLLLAAAQQRSRARLALAGVAVGAAIAVRTAAVIYLPAFLVFLVLTCDHADTKWSTYKLVAAQSAILFLGLSPGLALMLAHNYARFHSLLRTGYEGQAFNTPLYVGLYGLFFSTGRSLFLYSPLALVGLACSGHLRRQSRAMAGFSVMVLGCASLFYSGWWSWHGGWCWGPRFLVPVLPFLVLPIGARLACGRWWSVALVVWFISLLAVIPGITVDFNAYIVDFMQGNLALEPQLWFYPWASPLIGHWRYLLEGRALTLAGLRLYTHGMSRMVARLYWPIFGSLVILASVRLLYLGRVAPKKIPGDDTADFAS